MEKQDAGNKGRNHAQSVGEPKAKDDVEPCDKAFNQETARLKDKDEACDDGVK